MQDMLCVFNRTRESFLSLDVRAAFTRLAYLRGLFAQALRGTKDSLWTTATGNEAISLRHAVDIVYLDSGRRVIDYVEALPPFCLAGLKESASILHLPAGAIRGSHTRVGDELWICTAAELALLWAAERER